MIRLFRICLWALLELFALFSSASSYFDDSPLVCNYSRLPEIAKECSPFLSSASELKPDDNRGYMIKRELSFSSGDWKQVLGRSPLIPFDDSDLQGNDSLSGSFPLKLVGFGVKDVNPARHFENAVSLCGTMRIGMSRNGALAYASGFNFYMAPGTSVLKIPFEGVYIETEKDGEQRLLCMLGNTTPPFWNSVSDNSRIISSSGNNRPRLLQDDRLLLVLRYPQVFSLTKRSILGELRSLNEPAKRRYFDVVHISSQLGHLSKYQFSSEELKSKTCDLSLYGEEVAEDGANRFNKTEFCRVMCLFSEHLFNIVPNWRRISTSRFGPFWLGQEIKTIDPGYKNVRLMMQNLICDDSARFAAVFRAFSAEMDRDTTTTRTGLSGMTLSVEGMWDPQKGHLCLVACPGVTSSGLLGCDTQISLYFPRSFSIKQRSIIFGSISSTSSESNAYDPLQFELEICPSDLQLNHGIVSLIFSTITQRLNRPKFSGKEANFLDW